MNKAQQRNEINAAAKHPQTDRQLIQHQSETTTYQHKQTNWTFSSESVRAESIGRYARITKTNHQEKPRREYQNRSACHPRPDELWPLMILTSCCRSKRWPRVAGCRTKRQGYSKSRRSACLWRVGMAVWPSRTTNLMPDLYKIYDSAIWT